jgi:hypothetical protein
MVLRQRSHRILSLEGNSFRITGISVTLFKISCDTCQTNLNVRQKSAIGQILACPKCGSMVQVQPPEGWVDSSPSHREEPKKTRPFVKPVPDPSLPETLSTLSGSVSEGFEQPHVKTSEPGLKWQGNQDQSAPPIQLQETPATEPILPGDQWDSPRAQQRKKLLIVFSTTLAILLFGIAAIVFAMMQLGGQKNSPQLANEPVPQGSRDPETTPTTAEPLTTPASRTKTDPEAKSASSSPPHKNPSNPAPETNIPSKPDNDPATHKTPTPDPPASNPDPDSAPLPSENPEAPPGFLGKTQPDDDSVLPDFFRELDDFGQIFEQDEPLLRLREAFVENDLPGKFGLSRYYVAPSLKKTPDPDLALNVPLNAIAFQQVTLLEFLDFHFQLTSVPVAVDVTPILLAGIQLDQKFDILVKEKNTLQILETVAEKLGLVVRKGKFSLILTIPDRDHIVEKEYPVDDLAPTALQRQNLIEQLQWAQVRISEFLRHARHRKRLPPHQTNRNFVANQHRLLLSNSGKDQKITFFHSDPISLSHLFASLAKQNDLHVFVNWEAAEQSLLPSGNLPLAIEDETFAAFIGELADGARLKLVWHGENIVELTSDAGAASNLTFESYNIEETLSTNFPAEKLLAALKNLLSNNSLGDFKRSAIGIDPESQNVLYAVLPQAAHQNVLKILDTARRAEKK